MATGTTGTPDSSARRPIPGLGLVGELPAPRAPSLAVHDDRSAPVEDPERGDERLLVLVAAPDREHAAVAEHPRADALEQLRLAHELDAPADERAGEEVVHERRVVGGEDHRPVGHVL